MHMQWNQFDCHLHDKVTLSFEIAHSDNFVNNSYNYFCCNADSFNGDDNTKSHDSLVLNRLAINYTTVSPDSRMSYLVHLPFL